MGVETRTACAPVPRPSSLPYQHGRNTSLRLAFYPTTAKSQAGANAPRRGERQKCGVFIQMRKAVTICPQQACPQLSTSLTTFIISPSHPPISSWCHSTIPPSSSPPHPHPPAHPTPPSAAATNRPLPPHPQTSDPASSSTWSRPRSRPRAPFSTQSTSASSASCPRPRTPAPTTSPAPIPPRLERPPRCPTARPPPCPGSACIPGDPEQPHEVVDAPAPERGHRAVVVQLRALRGD